MADAVLAEFPELRHEPPDGCEAVYLPTHTVDWWADHYPTTVPQSPQGITGYACRDTVARRPQPEPKTERVPWWEAVADRRCLAIGPRVIGLKWASDGLYFTDDDHTMICSIHDPRVCDESGTVEVLIEDPS
jgi:hypothetical protein